MKKIKFSTIYAYFLGFILACVAVTSYGAGVIFDAEAAAQIDVPVLYVETIPEVKKEVVEKVEFVTVEVPPRPETVIGEDEKQLLAGVVHSEAGNQDMIGRRLVVDVVLNRVDSLIFPNTVCGVLEQEGQFSPASAYDLEDMEAVELELQSRLDHDVLWFRTGSYHNRGTSLFQHGAHYFSGR